MNRREDKIREREGANGEAKRVAAGSACDDFRALLFDHLAGELEPEQSDQVRAHLLTCEACRKAAAEIQGTLRLLEEAARDPDSIPTHLSEDRRKRVFWTFTHPLLDWMYRHHILVSLVIAIAVLVVVVAVMKTRELWGEEPEDGGGVTVVIGAAGRPITNATANPAPLPPEPDTAVPPAPTTSPK